MKILLINKYHYHKGGAERAYFDMADILREVGHEVAFFAMDHPKNESTPWSKYFVSEVDYQSQSYSPIQKLKAAIRIIWNIEANKKLDALIKEFQPDIAHAHNIYHQLSPSIFYCLKKKKIPIVLTLHDYKLVSPNYNLYINGSLWEHTSGIRCVLDRCVQGSRRKSLICATEKWVHDLLKSYHLVDALIAPSQFLKNKVQQLGWRGKEIQVIPNPLRKEELERAPYLGERMAHRLVFFGRLSREKGIHQVFQALANVPQKELVLIGEGPIKEELQNLAGSLGISERVQFLGPRFDKELEEELNKAEAVIVPSVWYENLPYVVTESLSLGAVVIAAHSGGIPERIQHGKNGFLYEMGNVDALTNILNSLANQDLESIREEAKASVQDLAPDIFYHKLFHLYQELLDTRSHS